MENEFDINQILSNDFRIMDQDIQNLIKKNEKYEIETKE